MEANIVYRQMRDDEKSEVFQLVKAAFDEYVLPELTEEGANEFYRAARDMIYDRPAGHLVMVAKSKTGLAGVIDVRNRPDET